jgi:hypothetical protein
MYSVRLTTKAHGVTTSHLFLFILFVTGCLMYAFGWNYFVIFCASSFVHVIIESGLYLSGLRKGEMYYRDFKLPKLMEILLRSMVEGPAFCVPAYFVADQYAKGNLMLAGLAAILVVGCASFYLGWFDRKHYRLAKNESELIISRRAMTRPQSVMLLALVNSICLIALMFIPVADRTHAFTYIFAYAGFVLLFYFINYNLGVRYIETFRHDLNAYEKPKLSLQMAGLVYDSAYEMSLLISPAYWLTYYLGFFS